VWTEIWALNDLVTEISLDGLVYTITVVPQERGYEIIQFRRPDSLGAAPATLRFVTEGDAILDEWRETSPSVFAPVSGRKWWANRRWPTRLPAPALHRDRSAGRDDLSPKILPV